MRLLLVTHESGLLHDTGPRHPERPERLTAVLAGIEDSGVDLRRVRAPEIEREDLLLVHRPTYVDAIERFCAAGGGALDPDTRVSSRSWEAALHSAGAGIAAVDALADGAATAAFVVTRPPGHHALADRAMGFCIFNNIAITARKLAAAGNRVAIVDWDVHHGNGTQDVFYADPGVLYISFHESPFYPGTGDASERGVLAGLGTTLNVPLPPGTGGDVYRWAFAAFVIPEIRRFGPDWLLVSSGFDAHALDPLADLALVAEDYAVMASALQPLVGPGRTVLFLEGGYSLSALRESAAATVAGLEGTAAALPDPGTVRETTGWAAVTTVARRLREERG